MRLLLSAHYKKIFLLCAALSLTTSSCHKVPDTIEPTLSSSVKDTFLLSLPSAFPPLTQEELSEDFGKEMQIGFGFAHELDLYQAITAFKRAEFLVPKDKQSRLEEIQYEILLCYYLGKRWQDVLYTFDHSQLRYVGSDFPAFHDLLFILYETYTQEKMQSRQEQIFQVILHYFPEEAKTLQISQALTDADFPVLNTFAATPPEKVYLEPFLEEYRTRKKSVGTAQTLNALLPGAGYLYLGQGQSATTAFFLNGLFIAAATYFFMDGNIPAGMIFTSFEAGWYFGGIYGAGLETKAYNERLYESMATPLMNQRRLFPTLMLKYAF